MGILSDLAERVEGLAGPNRKVDAEIADAYLGPVKPPFRRGLCLKYTASLDAAMTLVPEGIGNETLSVILKRSNIGNGIIHSAVLLDTLTGADWLGEAATLALALTAAALRAKEALGND